jgi:hypothetical protein
MNRFFLSLLLAASPALAATPDVQVFTARADGSLTIGVDGRVLDVELTSDGSLGSGVLAGYEERIRTWRFEPIVENGQPVNAKGLMQLSLVAAREKGNRTATFGIRSVRFMDPEPTSPYYPEGTRWTPPSYPMNALRAGVDADVMLVLKLDGQGRVLSAATEQLALRGVSMRQPHQANFAAQFRRSAEKAAGQWTITGQPEGQLVRVPLKYNTGRWDTGWAPTAIQPVELPEWAVLELTAEQATELNGNGVAVAEQFKLLTPLDGA